MKISMNELALYGAQLADEISTVGKRAGLSRRARCYGLTIRGGR